MLEVENYVVLCPVLFYDCFYVGPSYSPFSSVYGEKGQNEQNLNATFPQMYQSLHIPSTHSSVQNYVQSGGHENVDGQEYETDEFSSMQHQPPSLPLYAGGR